MKNKSIKMILYVNLYSLDNKSNETILFYIKVPKSTNLEIYLPSNSMSYNVS